MVGFLIMLDAQLSLTALRSSAKGSLTAQTVQNVVYITELIAQASQLTRLLTPESGDWPDKSSSPSELKKTDPLDCFLNWSRYQSCSFIPV
jgi:hypothetical protein